MTANKKTSDKTIKPKEKDVKLITRFHTMQYNTAGFHIPTARVSSKLKSAISGKAIPEAIKEIKRGQNPPSDDSSKNVQIPIKDMCAETRAFCVKSQELYE